MAAPSFLSPRGGIALWLLLATFLSFCNKAGARQIRWIQYTGNGGTVWLDDDRRPALFTGSFGDCQGNSLVTLTRFDAAYYKDNMTISFHMGGYSALTNESLMLSIGVYAYGESRFNLIFNPCNANINSLCPLNSSIPIEANGLIPIAQSDVANIPPIALSIPDFEGQAILRIFANSTQSQIGCFSAVISNGATFSHPAAIGSILGIFAFVAFVSSVALTVYGHTVPDTRNHYAHSLSVLVVFAVYQHIFFTGLLSMNWPSVLVAFWSNYGWSAGMIYSQSMQNTINSFIGNNRGNISIFGALPTNENAVGLGGGYSISSIYRRTTDVLSRPNEGAGSAFTPRELTHSLTRRALANSSSGFSWYGAPVGPGLPLPGNYSGFAGTLAELNIPASNAFMTGFLWFLILLTLIAITIVSLKWGIELLYRFKTIKTGRFAFFRQHWISFVSAAILRTCFIAFFMIIVLALFQLTLGGAKGTIAIAGVVFTIFFLGMFGLAASALYHRLRHGTFVKPTDKLRLKRSDFSLPSLNAPSTATNDKTSDQNAEPEPLPWWRAHVSDTGTEQLHPHDDISYTTKYGWLASRFRRSKWWFFAFWLVYEFVRACFYGGAAGHALTQVFGLLAFEFLAFIAVILLKPFESNRLNLLMVYFLGFSKVATVALSAAFDEKFRLGRILTTVIGVVIIVIQGILTICLMVAVIIGAISSYMSISRYHDDMKPKSWESRREKYFKHVDQKATDRPAPPAPAPSELVAPLAPATPKEPYFAVTAVRREPKIEDEDAGDEEHQNQGGSQVSVDQQAAKGPSRTLSMLSTQSTLPYGAKRHRASWSTRDFVDYEKEQMPSGLNSRMSIEDAREVANRHRAASLRGSRPEIPKDGTDSPVPKTKHRRTISENTNRNSSIVNEENEFEAPQRVPRGMMKVTN